MAKRKRKPPVIIDWTKELDAMLGTEPDRVVAERLHVTLLCVFGRRRRLGILPYHKRFRERHGKVLTSLWQQGKTDQQIADFFGWKAERVREYRKRHGLGLTKKGVQSAVV